MKKYLFLFIAIVLCNVVEASEKSSNEWFQKARPCWASGRQTEQNLTIALHSVVNVDEFSTSYFNIAAASSYRFYLNGEFMGYGPSITAHGFFRVDRYDLKDKLKRGKNIVVVEVAGYNVDNYFIPNQPSFVQAELLVDSKVVAATISTNKPEAFQMVISGQRVQKVPKFSFQRPFLESYRLNPDYAKWRVQEKLAFSSVDVEETDSKKLLPRGVKYPDYTIVKAEKNLENGIVEFSSNKTGFLKAKLVVTKPSKITLLWDEILVDGDISRDRSGCNSYVNYELEPGEYEVESFEPYTIKFLKMEVEEGECRMTEASIRQYINSDVSLSKFRTNDSRINSIYDAAVETYRQSALDVFMDCPSRERAGWLCDSYFTARVAYDLSGNTLIEHNFIENFLLPEKFDYLPEGMLPMCYPSDHPNGNYIPNWAMWFVLELEEYAHRSGDYRMVVELEDRVLKLVDFFERYKNEDGLLENLQKWVFVEWSDANRFTQDVNYPSNMLYAHMLEVVSRLYNKPHYWQQAQNIKQTIREQSFVNGFFTDNAIRKEGKLVVQSQNQTEVCQYFAFYFGIATIDSHRQLWHTLVNDFGYTRAETRKHLNILPANAFIGNYLRMELLAREGLYKQLTQETRHQFGYMTDLTGTLWENVTTSASTCHGFASHVAHVYFRDIAGINRIDQVNRVVHVRFTDSGITKCEATMPVADGLVSLDWVITGKVIQYKLIVPNGYKIILNNKTQYSLFPVIQGKMAE